MNDVSTHNREINLRSEAGPGEETAAAGSGRGKPRNCAAAAFADHYVPLGDSATTQNVVSALLKQPAQVICEIIQGNRQRISLMLVFIVIVCLLGYGVVMGMFSGGHQLWAVPAKVCLGLLLSAVICLPSLYIFTCLAGGDQSLSQVASLLLASLALGGILLIGFAPVAWVFSQATNASGFMGGIHLVFWGIGVLFGLRLLEAALSHLSRCNPAVFRTWAVIFILVILQMTTTLRPLVGEYQGARLLGKKFFLQHWGAPHKEAHSQLQVIKHRR